MIRFALVVASVLGFVLTAALGNMMVPLLRELQRAARGTQPDSDAPDSPVPTMGGLCLMVGTLAAVGVGWLAACAAQPSLLGSDRQMTSRLLIALLGSLAFGAVGLADDLARIRSRYPNGLGLGLRRTQRLALECIAAVLVLGLLPRKMRQSCRSQLSLATCSTVMLGTLLISSNQNYTLEQSIAFGLGSGLGYTFIVFIVREGRRRLRSKAVPAIFQGLPSSMIYIGVLSLAIYALVGHSVVL